MEWNALDKIIQGKGIDSLELPNFPGASLARIARSVLAAEAEGLRSPDLRLQNLEQAVAMQDKLAYMEPPFWYFPVRQLQGQALLEAGKLAEAEKVYREDLRRNPENGWSLYGLLQCLRAKGQADAAAVIESRFRDSWKHADITLTSSCF
jgi:tetratricopeptide (TPR) repeat protein